MTTKSFASRAAVVVIGVVALGTMAGCGGPQNKSMVSGTVTVDGHPLADGTIQFFPTDGQGQTGGGGIKDGRYTVDAGVGAMKIVVNGTKVVGKIKQYDTPDSPTVDDIRELLPAKYNTKTELTATLKPGPNDNVDFDLKSK